VAVTYIDLKTINKKQLDEVFSDLTSIKGYCIFIDIVGSTQAKYEYSVKEWIMLHKHTFSFFSEILGLQEYIVKFIGDEVMIFIPELSVSTNGVELTSIGILDELYSTLLNIKEFPLKGRFLDCKIAVNYCVDVYNISFSNGNNDYYGKEIDLSARLMKRTQTNRIVLSESFYEKVLTDSKSLQNDKPLFIDTISSQQSEKFKGVPHAVNYRFLDV